jgi:streptogramin lyase
VPELQIGSVIGGHRLEAVAGRGGMGVVYRSVHLALNRVVALKLIAPELAEDPEFRERFKRESETAASLDHPNVIPIYTAGEDSGRLYVTMRFVEGTDLREMIALQGRLEPRQAARIVSQVAAALDAAHARGLVHRDIKPANVLIGGSGEHAYLTDFGLTKQAASQSGLTRTGTIVGTMDYIAPEQLQGGQVDARADVYALGCVFFQTLTGEVPFPRETEPAKMWAHMSEEAPSLRDVAPQLPAPLDAALRRAMAKDPGDRFLSAGDLGRAGMAAVEGQAPTRAERSVATGEAAPTGVGANAAPTTAGQAPPDAAAATVLGEAAAPTGAPNVPPTGPAAAPAGWGPGGAPPVPGGPQAPPAGWPPAAPAAAPARRKSRLPLIAAVAGGVLALAAIVAVIVLATGGGGGEKAAGTIVGKPIPVGKQPYDVETGAGFVWTANLSEDTISKIDPSKRTAQAIKVGGSPVELGVEGGAVWVWNYRDAITRVDVATGEISDPISTGGPIDALAVGGGYVWLSHSKAGTVTRVNESTQKLEGDPIKLGSKPVSIGYGDNAAYVVKTGDDTIQKLDSTTGDVFGDPLDLNQQLGGIEVDNGVIYVGTTGDVTPIDEQSLTPGTPFPLKGGSVFTVGGDSAWVGYPLKNQIRRFDLDSQKQISGPIDGVGKGANDIIFGLGRIWVANTKQNSVTEIKPG